MMSEADMNSVRDLKSVHDRAHGITRALGEDTIRNPNPPLHVVFDQPVIPPNTGNAIRMCAGVGAHLHLCEPLGFNLEEKNLRRAGLDYHDLVDVTIHPSLDECLTTLGAGAPDGPKVYAFTSHTSVRVDTVSYQWGDVLLFGCEPTGLSAEALADPRVTSRVRIPMLPGRRSMNLSNAAAVGAYEAWRQLDYRGV